MVARYLKRHLPYTLSMKMVNSVNMLSEEIMKVLLAKCDIFTKNDMSTIQRYRILKHPGTRDKKSVSYRIKIENCHQTDIIEITIYSNFRRKENILHHKKIILAEVNFRKSIHFYAEFYSNKWHIKWPNY